MNPLAFLLVATFAAPAAAQSSDDLSAAFGDQLQSVRRLRQAPQAPASAPAPVSAPAAPPAGGGGCLADDPPPAAPDAAGRIEGRRFPSVFQAWTPASNLAGQAENLAHHDLVWSSPWGFRLKSDDDANPGLASRYSSLAVARGPQTVLLAEIRWHDGQYSDDDPKRRYLPADSPWWQRDGSGGRKAADGTGLVPVYYLNYKDDCFQQQVVRQCQAAIRSGFDGCFFDWWPHQDADQVKMLRRVRRAIGDALIVVNSNGSVPSDLADVNGVFTEGFGSWFWPSGEGGKDGSRVTSPPKPEAWSYLIRDLRALEQGARAPRVNAVEGWGDEGSDAYLRGLTALVLVYSNAYVLYSRPNKSRPDPEHPDQPHDHWHAFDAFWTQDLGAAVDPPQEPGRERALAGGAVYRVFSDGIAVFNPTSSPASVPADRLLGLGLSRSHKLKGALTPGAVLSIGPDDGDIFVK